MHCAAVLLAELLVFSLDSKTQSSEDTAASVVRLSAELWIFYDVPHMITKAPAGIMTSLNPTWPTSTYKDFFSLFCVCVCVCLHWPAETYLRSRRSLSSFNTPLLSALDPLCLSLSFCESMSVLSIFSRAVIQTDTPLYQPPFTLSALQLLPLLFLQLLWYILKSHFSFLDQIVFTLFSQWKKKKVSI